MYQFIFSSNGFDGIYHSRNVKIVIESQPIEGQSKTSDLHLTGLMLSLISRCLVYRHNVVVVVVVVVAVVVVIVSICLSYFIHAFGRTS